MRTHLTVPQRVGLGIVAMLAGILVAIPLYIVAVLCIFPRNWAALLHATRFTILFLGTVASYEAIMAGVTWFIFGSAMVALWPPADMRNNSRLAYLAALPLALLAPGLLATMLLRIHATHPSLPTMSRPLFAETFGFMLVTALVAIWRYMNMTAQAELLIASGGEFRY